MQALASRAARSLWWSQGLVLAAPLLPFLAAPGSCRSGVVAFACVALFLGARLALDAAVFRRWSRAPDLDTAMHAFDTALARCHLRAAGTAVRPLPARIDGAMRLRTALMLCVATQTALVALCR